MKNYLCLFFQKIAPFGGEADWWGEGITPIAPMLATGLF